MSRGLHHLVQRGVLKFGDRQARGPAIRPQRGEQPFDRRHLFVEAATFEVLGDHEAGHQGRQTERPQVARHDMDPRSVQAGRVKPFSRGRHAGGVGIDDDDLQLRLTRQFLDQPAAAKTQRQAVARRGLRSVPESRGHAWSTCRPGEPRRSVWRGGFWKERGSRRNSTAFPPR